jgi:hypothetical protein
MNRPFLMCATIAFILWSCGERTRSAESKSDSTAATADTTAKVESPYFPVYDFLSNEIEYVDSTPVGIMKYRTIGKVQDSGYIQLEEFHKLISEFQLPELKDSMLKRKFREISFVDKSNGNATFFYKPADTTTKIKRIDVVTAKGEVYDEVKSLYIEKDDSFMVKKLMWKPKRNFQIITIAPSGKNELLKVVLDNRE